mmetsp:Transcript_35813/g.57051  ORF Transcript_35813/g.57051 Transcript_35813/m.57051 type:complete len:444 (+) Transcript_35813:102-1433(+)
MIPVPLSASPFAKKGIGTDVAKRKEEIEGEGPTKRLKKDGSTLSEETKELVLHAAIDVLAQFHGMGEAVVIGSALTKALMAEPSVAELVNEIKVAFGGKGWMKSVLTRDGTIECIEIQEREPAYRLSICEIPIDLTKFQKAEHNEDFALPAEAIFHARKVLRRCMEVLKEKHAAGEEYCTGSALRTSLSPECDASVEAVAKAGSKSKGWIKLLLAQEPSIERVEVEGRGEPCYRLLDPLAEVKVTAKLKVKKTQEGLTGGYAAKGMGWGSGMMGKMGKGYGMGMMGRMMAGMGCGLGMMGKMGLMAGMAKGFATPALQYDMKGSGKVKGNSKGKNLSEKRSDDTKGASQERASVAEVPPDLALERLTVLSTLREALENMQAETGFVTGSKLSQVATNSCPAEANKIKIALQGKGWVKKLLASDPSIELVTGTGFDEPCYRLVT